MKLRDNSRPPETNKKSKGITMSYFSPAMAVVLLFLVTMGSASAAENAKDRKAIEEANAAFAAAFNKRDAKAIAEMYTENGQLFPPHEQVIEGRPAIEAFWKATMNAGIASVELQAAEIESFGDSIVESGRSTLRGPGNAVVERGKYLVLWKRVIGKWKLHRDCWNSSDAMR